MKSDFLKARDERQLLIDNNLSHCARGADSALLIISSNIPGSDKYRPGVCRLLCDALESLKEKIDLSKISLHSDILGPFYLAFSSTSPQKTKAAAIKVENQNPYGRLIDIDIYHPNGQQVDRTMFGIVSRSCLVCCEPARECILLQRHSNEELVVQVDRLLRPYSSFPQFISPDKLVNNLSLGALCELNLTPKPGLVDRYNSGSHNDLSYSKMLASVELLPLLFKDIINCYQKRLSMQHFVQTGIAAEKRMTQAVNANAHKGFIFLSSMLLMSTYLCEGHIGQIRQKISSLAKNFFANFGSTNSRSAHIKHQYGLGGIKAEIEQGLPSIFEHSWPRYREALKAEWSPKHADFYLMALLMQKVEDTTAVYRCGLDGLDRLRRDGKQLQRCLENRQDPEPMLSALNQEYCRLGLTMGGVADCMAITFALQRSAN